MCCGKKWGKNSKKNKYGTPANKSIVLLKHTHKKKQTKQNKTWYIYDCTAQRGGNQNDSLQQQQQDSSEFEQPTDSLNDNEYSNAQQTMLHQQQQQQQSQQASPYHIGFARTRAASAQNPLTNDNMMQNNNNNNININNNNHNIHFEKKDDNNNNAPQIKNITVTNNDNVITQTLNKDENTLGIGGSGSGGGGVGGVGGVGGNASAKSVRASSVSLLRKKPAPENKSASNLKTTTLGQRRGFRTQSAGLHVFVFYFIFILFLFYFLVCNLGLPCDLIEPPFFFCDGNFIFQTANTLHDAMATI